MKWTERQWEVFRGHFGEAFREIGVLWLVFSCLDRVVSGTFTWLWGFRNILGAIAMWAIGTYIDIRDKQ